MRKILTFRPKCPICGNRPRMLTERSADNHRIIMHRAYCCQAMMTSYTLGEDMALKIWKDRVKEYQDKQRLRGR